MEEKKSDRYQWDDVPNFRMGGGNRRGKTFSPSTSSSNRMLTFNSRAGGLNDGDVGHAYASNARGGYRGGPRSNLMNDSARKPVVEDGTWHTRGGRPRSNEWEKSVFLTCKDKTVGINFDSYDSIAVEISGSNTQDLRPLQSFKEPGTPIEDKLMANIERVQYDKPTPVQKYAIPILLAGRDLMACAQTGSGKTAAFLFPIIIHMLLEGPPAKPPTMHGANRHRPAADPVALVLSPTRELTCQIATESRKFAFETGIRTVVVYGGAEVSTQVNDLARGCDICVATPGRLNDLMERGRVSLSMIKYLVLDEADRMLDMGFAPQIHDIIETKDMPSSETRQTAMFSATFPKEIQQLAASFMKDYVYLTVGRVGSTSEFITQKFLYAEEAEKPRRLLQVLQDANGRVLVFVETKRKADLIEKYLNENNLNSISIHGDRTQSERSAALELFKRGQKPILVATDVAARGLDIHSITWVINLDLPHNIEDYVHRIGRTGRAGNNGLATSFVNEGNKAILRDLHRKLEEAHQEVPAWFIDLTKACSATNTRGFGSSRYGGGNRGGNSRMGGGGQQFGGHDFRQAEQGRRTFANTAGSNKQHHASEFNRHAQPPAGDDCWY